MRNFIRLSFALLSVSLLSAAEVDDIIRKAEQAAYYAAKDGRADVKMVIHDAAGGTREREFRILRRNGEGRAQQFYVYFLQPADVSRMAYLVWKHDGDKEDDRWLWLPSIGRVNRIAPGDKRTAFVGSDFVYEDVSGRNPADDQFELLETTDAVWRIRATPRKPDSVEFASYEIWIDRATHLPLRAEYRDARGEIYRRVTADKIEEIQGIPTVLVSTVEDLTRKSRTVNTFSNVSYNLDLPENIFSERFLRRPPREATQ